MTICDCRLLARAGLLLAAFTVAGCREKVVAGPEQALPNQIVESFVLHESNSGQKLYMMEAECAYVYDGDQRVDVVKPIVTFYDENGAVHSRLVADAGTIYSRNEDLVARGHVVVRTEDSTSLATDSLCWSNVQRIVRTDAPVEISTPKGVIRGQGLVSDAGLNKIQIQSEVRGTSNYDFETGK